MRNLKWINIKKQTCPKDKKATFLAIDSHTGLIAHAGWFRSNERCYIRYEIKSYPTNRPLYMPITHWCELPSVGEWNDMDTMKNDIGSSVLVLGDSGGINHMYVNKNGHLRLFKSGAKTKSTSVGWLSLPEFDD